MAKTNILKNLEFEGLDLYLKIQKMKKYPYIILPGIYLPPENAICHIVADLVINWDRNLQNQKVQNVCGRCIKYLFQRIKLPTKNPKCHIKADLVGNLGRSRYHYMGNI